MGSLRVHVVDDDQKPVSGEKVFCNFVNSQFGFADSHSIEYTDDSGVAEFDEVPVGTVEVMIDGCVQLEVSVRQNDHEDVTVTV